MEKAVIKKVVKTQEEILEDRFEKAKSKYEEAIVNHEKRGIHTHIFICETGETCILRSPTVRESTKVMPYILGFNVDIDLGKAGVEIIETCWIAGDDAIRAKEDLLYEVAMSVVPLIEVKIADVKKN